MRKLGLMVLTLSLAACAMPVIDGQMPVVAVQPIVLAESGKAIHVCEIKPFTETFRSESVNRGKAKLNVQKQCLAKHSAMFCEEKDIVCKVYE